MTAQILNTNQLKSSLTHQIEKLRDNIELNNIPQDEIVELFKLLLQERKFLLIEIENLKTVQQTYESALKNKSYPSVVTLSEIEENLYNDFQNMARKLSQNEGEVLNKLMELFLTHSQNKKFPKLTSSDLIRKIKDTNQSIRIRNHKSLTISDEDLQNLDTKVDFSKIDKLYLDINPKNFKKYINSINNCQEVHIPSKVSKLLVYARTTQCQEIHLSPPDSETCLEYAREANQVVEAWDSEK
jgi:hypothetical protein